MFELAFPQLLFALPLPWIIWLVLPRASTRLPTALTVPFFKIALQTEYEKPQRQQGFSSFFTLFLAWGLMLFGLAGPRWVGDVLPLKHEGYNLMLALDISPSMEANDMISHGRTHTRLSVVKDAAEQFVKDRSADRIGLILFGARAYLQTPLTHDHRNVLTRIKDASVGLAGKSTSIGDALGLAVKHLQNVPKKGRVIVLLTDGVNNSGVLAPQKAAELAKQDGIKVYTIGLSAEGANSGDSLFLGLMQRADLDEEALKSIASLTGGLYFRATDPRSLQAIYQTINKMETVSQEHSMIRPQKEYYPWFVALALSIILVWLAVKRGMFSWIRSL